MSRHIVVAGSFAVMLIAGRVPGGQVPPDEANANSASADVSQRRLEIMKGRVESIVFSAKEPGVPKQVQSTPLFRYDDETRGYVDGTVWRLGEKGRPLAIVTAELHPRYLNGDSRIVYDFLSLTDRPFRAVSPDVAGWSPRGSAVAMQPLPDAPSPSPSAAKRLTQLKRQSRRFSGTQEVDELAKTFVHLRLLPKEIDHYSPAAHEQADGAIFVLVNGRNPALAIVIETDGKEWQYGVGRLSSPSRLEVRLDEKPVWSQPRFQSFAWSEPYTASNSAAEFP